MIKGRIKLLLKSGSLHTCPLPSPQKGQSMLIIKGTNLLLDCSFSLVQAKLWFLFPTFSSLQASSVL